ncbi:MAG: hypothetical protein U0572_14245 [Phycisphaerales bacterium]
MTSCLRCACVALCVGLSCAGIARADEVPTTVRAEFTATRAADSQPAHDSDEMAREALGRLVFSRVTIDADDRPVREVLTKFARALELNFVPFYETPDQPAPRLGLSPDRRISMYLRDADGRTVLEAIAAQCGPEVTWQLQRGMVEFGPREALARQGARRTAVYDVTDLALEAPYLKPGCPAQVRLRPKDVIADLVRAISEQCEPDAFRPEPPPTEQELAEGAKQLPVKHTAPSTPSPNPRTGVNSTGTRNLDPDVGPIFVLGRWAEIHVKDNTLVVSAPDFVHRAIGGYPKPLPPRGR